MTSSACWFWAWQVWVPNFKKDWLGPQSVVVVIVNCRLGPTFNLFSCQRCYWLMMAFSFWLDRMFPLTAKANWALFSCLCSVIGICHFVICNMYCHFVIVILSCCHQIVSIPGTVHQKTDPKAMPKSLLKLRDFKAEESFDLEYVQPTCHGHPVHHALRFHEGPQSQFQLQSAMPKTVWG